MCIRDRVSLAWLFCPGITEAIDHGNEVSVWIEPGRAVATSLVSGRRETPLDVQEAVIGSGVSGINAIVVTSRRLLGFSSRTLISVSYTHLRANETPEHLVCRLLL